MPTPFTALRETCILETPSALLNEASRFARDNIARCIRRYTLGWGMSNCPHASTLVVGRDTGWMCVGADAIGPWFTPEALKVFRDSQKPNGQILEYMDLETGDVNDYGLNIADNTPLYLWAVGHHNRQYADEAFRRDFLPSVRAAADHLLRETGPNGLLVGVPAGTCVHGITGWRNIIPDTVMAGESTEINSLSAMALREASEFTGEARYAAAAEHLAAAINAHLWTGEGYALNRDGGHVNAQVTGDAVFPVLCVVAPPDRARRGLDRLAQPDFWTGRGMRTLPSTDPACHPSRAAGLLGGSWPNLTLWYAVAVAPHDPDRALAALETVARAVVEPQPPEANVVAGEFPEYFDGESGANLGMSLSPWVAPTFLWAVLEGLLGLTWRSGRPHFTPHWPGGWEQAAVRHLPCADGPTDVALRREAIPQT